MNTVLKSLAVAACTLAIIGCSEESSVSTGAGGAPTGSDGGAASAAFAGTYVGTGTVKFSGGSVPDVTKSRAITLVIRTDGTITLTIGDDSVSGEINGSSFSSVVHIVESGKGITCEGDIVYSGSVNGSVASGTVNGSGECKAIGIKTGVDVSGSFSATKT